MIIFPESARFTAEDVERLKKLIEEKAEMRREGLLKQKRPVIKIELEDANDEGGIEAEVEGGKTPRMKLEIKQEVERLEIRQESGLKLKMEQESGLMLEPKQEPRLRLETKHELKDTKRATQDDEMGCTWEELEQKKPAGSGLDGEQNQYDVQDQNVNQEGSIKKSVKKAKKVKPKLKESWEVKKVKPKPQEEYNWEVSPLLPTGWKFHQSSRVFRTSKGEALQSYSKALQHMMVTEGYSDEQMDNLQKFIEEKDAVGEDWNSDLEDMEEEHHINRVEVEKTTDKVKKASSGIKTPFQNQITQGGLKDMEEEYQIARVKDNKKSLQIQIAPSKTPLKLLVKAETKTKSAKKIMSPSMSKQGGNGGEATPSGKRRRSSGDFMSSPTILETFIFTFFHSWFR